MKVEINKRDDNPFLERKELEGTIEHSGAATPSAESLKEYLAKELNVDSDSIEIDKIFTIHGMQKSKFWAKELDVKESKKTKAKGAKKEKTEKEPEKETSDDDDQYSEILSGSISDAKEKINNLEEPDFEKLMEIEKSNKDRKGMKSFLKKNLEE